MREYMRGAVARLKRGWGARGAAVVVVVAVLAGCGSSSSSSSSASGSQAAASSSAKGSPITFGSIAAINTPTGNYPGIFAALKAGAAEVNQTGGINGHPVKIWTCNTQGTAAGEIDCARSAASSGVLAVISDLNAFSSFKEYGQILSSAGVLDIENTGPYPNGFEGPTAFPLTLSLGTLVGCLSSPLAKAAGGNKVALITQAIPPTETLDAIDANIAKAQGTKIVKTILVPQTAPDLASTVAEAQGSGANIVMLQIPFGDQPQTFVRDSSAAGAHYAICSPIGITGQGGWAGTGSAANNLYVAADFAPLTSSAPGMKQFLSHMAAIGASSDLTPATFKGQYVDAWLGMQAAVQAAKNVSGPVTRASLKAAMAKTSATFGGVIPPIDFSKAPASPAGSNLPLMQAYTRVFSSPAYLWKWIPSQNQYKEEGSFTNAFAQAAFGKIS